MPWKDFHLVSKTFSAWTSENKLKLKGALDNILKFLFLAKFHLSCKNDC